MSDLIERLEKATEPSRYIDRSIHVYLVEKGLDADGPDKGCHPLLDKVPRYTASLDAALTLVPGNGRLLELGQWQDNGRPTGWFAQVTRWIKTGEHSWTDQGFAHGIAEDGEMPKLAPNGAIAICIAALKAHPALSQQNHTGGK